MAMSGMAAMLKSLGVDPEKIQRDIETFTKGAQESLKNIDTKLAQLERVQADILKLAQELTAWKRQLVHQQLNQQQPQPTAPPPPNPLPAPPPPNLAPQQ